ncbi:MAG: SDR family NAD(P)-dependent oxidoreductase [Spirochaetota bacterium]|nr:SDR family NAD(P)-dependent oxidoreductase [Spirochaetota bacterium]
MKIKGKTAVITGAASGLGAATARRLHSLGANVLIADMNEAKGGEVSSELGSNAVFSKMNVTDTKEIQAGIELAMNKFKSIDILVNCAGTGFAMRTVGKEGPHDLEIFKTVINVNLIGTFDAIRQAAFQMQNNEPDIEGGERGVIVNTASVAAFDGQIGQVSYTASKAGIVGMTLPIARDLSIIGVRICTIAPGIFDTPLMQAFTEEGKASLLHQTQFPKRFGKPDEFAMLAQQIIENPVLNGETIRLDGGIRMGPK